jgi:hypothetical protein
VEIEKGEEGGLVNILEERNLLPSQQYGFRKNKSTTDVLTILENNIANKNNQPQWCLSKFKKLTICAGDTIS